MTTSHETADERLCTDLKAFEEIIETGREAILREPSRWSCPSPAPITPELSKKFRDCIAQLHQEASSKAGNVTGYEYIPSRGVFDIPIEVEYRSVLEWLVPRMKTGSTFGPYTTAYETSLFYEVWFLALVHMDDDVASFTSRFRRMLLQAFKRMLICSLPLPRDVTCMPLFERLVFGDTATMEELRNFERILSEEVVHVISKD